MKTKLKFITLFYLILILIFSVNEIRGQEQKGISKILWTANWSHDNQYIAIGGVDKKIRVFSGKTFELLKVIENNTEIQRMSWHPTLHLLAVAAVGDGSKLIDIDKDSIILLKGANANGTRAISWNYKGDLLANADYEGEITIWNHSGELIQTIRKENTVSNVAIDWHPFKNEFIVLSDEFVRTYNSEGTLLNKFKHKRENVLMLCVKWHPSGDFFVIGDYGDKERGLKPFLQFWKSNGTLKKEVNLSKSEYRNLAWTKGGHRLATASDALRIWTKKGKLIAEGLSLDNLWGVDWSPDGKFIVTSSFEGHIKIWDNNAKLLKELKY